MQIKDLVTKLPVSSLKGAKVKTTTGQVGFWSSYWKDKGVVLDDQLGDKRNKEIKFIFIEDIKDVLEWEVLDNFDFILKFKHGLH
jgi:hypothetical protein